MSWFRYICQSKLVYDYLYHNSDKNWMLHSYYILRNIRILEQCFWAALDLSFDCFGKTSDFLLNASYVFRSLPECFKRLPCNVWCLLSSVTVHFIWVCQTLFDDNFFITAYFWLKLSWCVSTFFMLSLTTFQLDPTKDKEFPHRPHCKIRALW